MWISLVTIILLRVPVAYILAYLSRNEAYPKGQPFALFTSLLVSWSVGMIVSLIVFRIGKWKKKMVESAAGFAQKD